jgi:hypothetical protein
MHTQIMWHIGKAAESGCYDARDDLYYFLRRANNKWTEDNARMTFLVGEQIVTRKLIYDDRVVCFKHAIRCHEFGVGHGYWQL